MTAYYPYGEPIFATEEQIEKEKEKFRRYEYYGISYGHFDNSDSTDEFESKRDSDRREARSLIMRGMNIPNDLEARLLQYKQQDEKRNHKRNKEVYNLD